MKSRWGRNGMKKKRVGRKHGIRRNKEGGKDWKTKGRVTEKEEEKHKGRRKW